MPSSDQIILCLELDTLGAVRFSGDEVGAAIFGKDIEERRAS